MGGVRWMSDNFVFLAGTYLSFKTRGPQIYWQFGEFQWVAEAQLQSVRDSPNFSPFGRPHRPPALRSCNSRSAAVMAGLVRGHPTCSPPVGRVIENAPLPLSPRRGGERGISHLFDRRATLVRFRNSIAVSGMNPAITERARLRPAAIKPAPTGASPKSTRLAASPKRRTALPSFRGRKAWRNSDLACFGHCAPFPRRVADRAQSSGSLR
jgi:hypothetical protein